MGHYAWILHQCFTLTYVETRMKKESTNQIFFSLQLNKVKKTCFFLFFIYHLVLSATVICSPWTTTILRSPEIVSLWQTQASTKTKLIWWYFGLQPAVDSISKTNSQLPFVINVFAVIREQWELVPWIILYQLED